jgi:hypothetical protein
MRVVKDISLRKKIIGKGIRRMQYFTLRADTGVYKFI